MTKKDEFLTYVLEDVLGHVPGITSRAMFGGYGIYKEGLIFSIIAYDQLYFKVGDKNIDDFKEVESHPFVYERDNHKKTTMSYWLVPEEVMNDKDKIKQWVEKAVEVSKESKKSKKKK